mmetsp:Transcript_11242/g.26190  ORF Transcript_11242/g.26190 Transcript_11242/m.26190 type:complete len:399 (-) Transcript_11242:11-1207(-)
MLLHNLLSLSLHHVTQRRHLCRVLVLHLSSSGLLGQLQLLHRSHRPLLFRRSLCLQCQVVRSDLVLQTLPRCLLVRGHLGAELLLQDLFVAHELVTERCSLGGDIDLLPSGGEHGARGPCHRRRHSLLRLLQLLLLTRFDLGHVFVELCLEFVQYLLLQLRRLLSLSLLQLSQSRCMFQRLVLPRLCVCPHRLEGLALQRQEVLTLLSMCLSQLRQRLLRGFRHHRHVSRIALEKLSLVTFAEHARRRRRGSLLGHGCAHRSLELGRHRLECRRLLSLGLCSLGFLLGLLPLHSFFRGLLLSLRRSCCPSLRCLLRQSLLESSLLCVLVCLQRRLELAELCCVSRQHLALLLRRQCPHVLHFLLLLLLRRLHRRDTPLLCLLSHLFLQRLSLRVELCL